MNDILHIVNVGSSEYETGVLYEFLLEAWDEAGNRSTAAYSYTKKDGDGTAQKREPVWFLEHPAYLQVGKNEYSLPENTNYLELKSRSSQELSSVEWYIDNQKIGALYQHTDRPWILDFHKIKAGYPEGTKHTIIVKCKDESGNVTYSVPEYKRALLEYLPVTSGSVKTGVQRASVGIYPGVRCKDRQYWNTVLLCEVRYVRMEKGAGRKGIQRQRTAARQRHGNFYVGKGRVGKQRQGAGLLPAGGEYRGTGDI